MKTLLLSSMQGVDHTQGVIAALISGRISPERWILECLPECALDDAQVIVLADCCGPWAIRAIRLARASGARVVLLQDGVCEWRNMFSNRRVPAGMLRPAPADTICCVGQQDQLVLEHLGNRAIATGLPRLRRCRDTPLPEEPAVAVMTAKHAWFSQTERQVVLEWLDTVRKALHKRGLKPLWRLSSEACQALGVSNEPGALPDVLAAASAVVTLPSTVLLESMLCQRPTILLHPFDTPCLLPSVFSVMSQPERRTGIPRLDDLHAQALGNNAARVGLDDFDDMLDAALEPDESHREAQQRVLEILHTTRDAAHNIAGAIVQTGRQEPGPGAARSLTTFARLPSAAGTLQREKRDLRVVTQPEHTGGAPSVADGQDVCILDPTWDPATARSLVARALKLSRSSTILIQEDGRSDEVPTVPGKQSDAARESMLCELFPDQPKNPARIFRRVLDRLRKDGVQTIALYGTGRYAHSIVSVLQKDDPITGFIDDRAIPGEKFLGKPVVRLEGVESTCNPEAVVICSDAHEPEMIARCATHLSESVRVIGVDGKEHKPCKNTPPLRATVNAGASPRNRTPS